METETAARVARALYGAAFVRPLARALDISERGLQRRFASGEAFPPALAARIIALASDGAAELRARAAVFVARADELLVIIEASTHGAPQQDAGKIGHEGSASHSQGVDAALQHADA
jgi:hypothetical protein